LDEGLALRLAHGSALIGRLSVDGALDLEQGVDAPDHLDGDGRDRRRLLACGLAPGGALDVSEDEERAPGVAPASGLQDGARLSVGRIELAVAAVGVGLEDAGVSGQMRLR